LLFVYAGIGLRTLQSC